MARIFLVQGYLSEREGLPHGPHPAGNDELGPWGGDGRRLARLVDDPVFIVNWPAGSGYMEYLSGKISPFEYYRRFTLGFGWALAAADRAAEDLGRTIRESGETAIVIGQSFGGRVALKVREHTPARVIALAPPLSCDDLDWDRFRASKEPAECYFSCHDWMIGLFGAVTLPRWGTNLGVHGVPPHLTDILRPIDVSLHDDGRTRGHGDVFGDWIDLLRRHSTILKPRQELAAPEAQQNRSE